MDIYFYNTLTKQKDLFKPIEEGKVNILVDQQYIKMQQ